jgi:hypothetical protein
LNKRERGERTASKRARGTDIGYISSLQSSKGARAREPAGVTIIITIYIVTGHTIDIGD